MIEITVLRSPEGPNADAENKNSTTPMVMTTTAPVTMPTRKIIFKHPDLIHAPSASRSTRIHSVKRDFQKSTAHSLSQKAKQFERDSKLDTEARENPSPCDSTVGLCTSVIEERIPQMSDFSSSSGLDPTQDRQKPQFHAPRAARTAHGDATVIEEPMENRTLKEGESPGPVVLRLWPAAATPPVISGALWLWFGTHDTLLAMLLAAVPGILLLATGLSNLLWSADPRIFQFMSTGALLGMLLAFPFFFVVGPLAALALLIASAASFVAAGYLAVGQEPVAPEAPKPEMDFGLAARAAWDEVSMCGIVLTTAPLAVGRNATRIRCEIDEALEIFEDRGWLDVPAIYHQTPPPLETMDRGTLIHAEAGFEHILFDSLYEPRQDDPGRKRWLSHERNRTAHAWVLRHPGEPRPWVVCLHGIRMGSPKLDLRHFRPDYLYHGLGLNLLFPILPTHGPRRVGLVSGDRVLSGDAMDSLHAGAQMAWDVRRLTRWLRISQNAPSVGLLGNSLGGYSAALLSCLDDNVDCVVVGSPATDPTRLFWQNALSLSTRYLKAEGVREEDTARLLRPVSPLAMDSLVGHDRRAIFAGVADRVVPPIEAVSLWRHWQQPRIAWYRGTHRGFLRIPEARAVLEETLRAAKILPGSR